MATTKTSRPLRVVVVDDSSFVRRAIARMLEGDPRVAIVGQASSGEELLTHLDEWQPGAITLDLSMPGMGGLATLDRVMAVRPTPVIILSTHSAKDAPLTIEALHRGALDFIDKQQYSLVDFESLRSVIVEKLLQVTQGALPEPSPPLPVPPTAPKPKSEPRPSAPPVEVERSAKPPKSPKPPKPPKPPRTRPRYRILLVGASTGGPPTIQRLLEDLGADLPLPVAIVQHMPVGFTRAFAERLNAHLAVQVREVSDGEVLLPATVYIAPAGKHLKIVAEQERLVAALSDDPEDATHRPAVDVLFHSAVRSVGRDAVAVLLTGMGADGADGLEALKTSGAYTLVQDEASCIVYGMPRAAMQRQAAREQLPLGALGERLHQLFRIELAG
jgi:two-component system chemotaxis response regulator CheB